MHPLTRSTTAARLQPRSWTGRGVSTPSSSVWSPLIRYPEQQRRPARCPAFRHLGSSISSVAHVPPLALPNLEVPTSTCATDSPADTATTVMRGRLRQRLSVMAPMTASAVLRVRYRIGRAGKSG
jgi:hypothetical protein